jgi:hypothetical protein
MNAIHPKHLITGHIIVSLKFDYKLGEACEFNENGVKT